MNTNISKAAAALGRKGGLSNSQAKQTASRKNGTFGGRPAKWEGHFTRRYGHIVMSFNLARNDSGDTWETSTALRLGEDGGPAHLDEIHEKRTEQSGWRDRKSGREYPLSHLDFTKWIMSAALRKKYAEIERPLTDAEMDAIRAKVAPIIGVLNDWPTEAYSGTVRLSGSRDRWVIAIGQGGHEDNLPGTFASSKDAREELELAIWGRQERISRIVAKRCEPHVVRCVFPALDIQIVGDETITAKSLGNRAQRRARLQSKE